MDTATRQVMAFPVRDRSRKSAAQLWANIPAASRAQTTYDTDQYAAHKGAIPAASHRAMPKNARKTNHIERFHHTRQPWVARLVREILASPKKLANHIGAIRSFICHDNLTRSPAFLV
jgi:insertion element IS1 protein InsB